MNRNQSFNKKMKITLFCLFAICLWMEAAVITVSAKEKATYVYSNLTDYKTRAFVSNRLRQAGIPEENINLFMNDVRDYNKAVRKIGLTEKGFVKTNKLPYNPNRANCRREDAKRIAEWKKHYTNFEGYNCRLTAFTLFKNSVKVKHTCAAPSTFLSMDLANLAEAPAKHFTVKETARFWTVFDPVMTPVTDDAKKVQNMALQQWKDAGIVFPSGCKASLITVRIHMNVDDEKSELDIGHVGVLVPDKSGYLFVEKLSFQTPYQVLKFHDKKELKEYLLRMYKDYTDPSSVKPFIMENNHIL